MDRKQLKYFRIFENILNPNVVFGITLFETDHIYLWYSGQLNNVMNKQFTQV